MMIATLIRLALGATALALAACGPTILGTTDALIDPSPALVQPADLTVDQSLAPSQPSTWSTPHRSSTRSGTPGRRPTWTQRSTSASTTTLCRRAAHKEPAVRSQRRRRFAPPSPT